MNQPPDADTGCGRRHRNRVAQTLVLLLATAMAASVGFGAPPAIADSHLEFFLRLVRTRPGAGPGGSPPPVSQTALERLLRILPPVAVGHGAGPPLETGASATPDTVPDPSVYGFCYEACRTERAVGSCGTPLPGGSHPPERLCSPVEDNPTLDAIIGPSLGYGVSPFVDDNTGPDGSQPAGYTFLGQFIDHDVTRTTAALMALDELSQQATTDAGVRTRLIAAGITPAELRQAVADATAPGSAFSANTGKLDLDSVYGVADFAALAAISAPWFEQKDGLYTGRFVQREVAAPVSPAAPGVIDGFDYQRAADGTAEIPDARNSEHKLISQIQNLFELAHNDCVNHALAGVAGPSQEQVASAFDTCRQKVLWTYQTIVATDFLPRFSAEAILDRVAPGSLHAYIRGAVPSSVLPRPADIHTFLYSCRAGLGGAATIRIPHEFAVAAFRLGHSLVRDDYVLHAPVRAAGGTLLTGQE
ncbi:MAG: peroxidase family protein, partial [Stellaceae bacterium]